MTRRRANNEGSIRKRPDGRWEVRISLPDGKRRSLYAKTQREALKRKAVALADVERGVALSGDQVTVEAFLLSWLRDSATQRVQPRTLASYEGKIRHHLNPALGNIKLSKLTPQQVERMMRDEMAAGASAGSVAHYRSVLRNALNAAQRWGLVSRNVAALATPAPKVSPEIRVPSVDEALAILEAVRADRLEALFTVALALGLRQSEALGLGWTGVDLDNATIRIDRSLQRINRAYAFTPVKSANSRRTIPLPPPVVASLRAHRARQLEERIKAGPAWTGAQWQDLVFADEAGGPLSGFHVTKRFRRLLATAGLPDMRYHDLRHAAASLMSAQGIAARTVMETLGHSDIGVTMNVYTHVLPDAQRDAAARMGRALWPNGGSLGSELGSNRPAIEGEGQHS